MTFASGWGILYWLWGCRVWGFLTSGFSIVCLHSFAWLALQHLPCPESTRKVAVCLERPLVTSILMTVTCTIRIGVLGARVIYRKGTLWGPGLPIGLTPTHIRV